MTAVLLDHPWVLLGLLYVVGWLIVCVCALRRSSPPQPDVPPAGPAATGKARARATE